MTQKTSTWCPFFLIRHTFLNHQESNNRQRLLQIKTSLSNHLMIMEMQAITILVQARCKATLYLLRMNILRNFWKFAEMLPAEDSWSAMQSLSFKLMRSLSSLKKNYYLSQFFKIKSRHGKTLNFCLDL